MKALIESHPAYMKSKAPDKPREKRNSDLTSQKSGGLKPPSPTPCAVSIKENVRNLSMCMYLCTMQSFLQVVVPSRVQFTIEWSSKTETRKLKLFMRDYQYLIKLPLFKLSKTCLLCITNFEVLKQTSLLFSWSSPAVCSTSCIDFCSLNLANLLCEVKAKSFS